MNSQSQMNYSASAQALPNHNTFWSTVLHQENSLAYQTEQSEATPEDSPETDHPPVWQPMRYQLSLGLRGWSVLQTVVEPAAVSNSSLSSSMSTDSDWRCADHHPNQEDVTSSDANSTISDLSDHESGSTSSDHNEGLLTMFRHLRNPQIEESQQGLLKGLEILYMRLHPSRFGIFQIWSPPSVCNTTFSRQVLSQVYGGSAMDTFPSIDKNRRRSQYNRFMCLNLLYNPYGPQHPGAPGLFFALREPSRWPKEQELVFSRYGTNQWNLMGKYLIKRSAPLSGEEFSCLDENVQHTWLNSIWNHKWGQFTLAAVYLRRSRRREPTSEEIEYFAKSRISLVRRKISRDDVKQAFLNGEENINVWTMKCIGYDETFKGRLLPGAVRAGGQATTNRTLITRYNLRYIETKRSGAPKKACTNAKRRRF